MHSVELFSGCGGLALGLARAGFEHLLLVERDKHSVVNMSHNIERGIDHMAQWRINSGDVRKVHWSQFRDTAAMVAGGPPCQPFSIGGLHRGEEDTRDMWPEAVRAVREVAPQAFLFENVRGLLRPKFAEHLEWIRLSLTEPWLIQQPTEDRATHLQRLRKHEHEGIYHVTVAKVNAADYGAAQKRHRVIFVGVRRDIAGPVEIPEPTHSRERLLWEQFVTGEYWDRHGLKPSHRQPCNSIDAKVVEKLVRSVEEPKGLAWRTVRDAISDLGEPLTKTDIPDHVLQPGARAYPGHTGSPMDEPAKALKAGVHGVPGGENMIAFGNGKVRYFTVREAARLQGLPDDYEFVGSWSENMRQLGNAVPTQLAECFGRHLIHILTEAAAPKGRKAA